MTYLPVVSTNSGDVTGTSIATTVARVNGAKVLMSGMDLQVGRTLGVVAGAKPVIHTQLSGNSWYVMRRDCDDIIENNSGVYRRFILPVGASPGTMAVGAGVLWVSSSLAFPATLYKIDQVTGLVLASYPLASGSVGPMVWDGTLVWFGVLSTNTIVSFNPVTHAFTTYTLTGHPVYSIYVGPAPYLYCGCNGRVVKFDTTAHTHTQVNAPVATGRLAMLVKMTASNKLAVLDPDNTSLYRYDLASDTFDATNLGLGSGYASSMAFSGTNLLVGLLSGPVTTLQEVRSPEAVASLGYVVPTPGVSALPVSAQVSSIMYDDAVTMSYILAEGGSECIQRLDRDTGATLETKYCAGLLSYANFPDTSCVIVAGSYVVTTVGYTAIGAAHFNAGDYLGASFLFEVNLQSSSGGIIT